MIEGPTDVRLQPADQWSKSFLQSLPKVLFTTRTAEEPGGHKTSGMHEVFAQCASFLPSSDRVEDSAALSSLDCLFAPRSHKTHTVPGGLSALALKEHPGQSQTLLSSSLDDLSGELLVRRVLNI